jgi:hypothetical protein
MFCFPPRDPKEKAPFLGISRERALYSGVKDRISLFYIPKSAMVPFLAERQQQQQHAGWVVEKNFIIF